MKRADSYLSNDAAPARAHRDRQRRFRELRKECASLQLSCALALSAAPPDLEADAETMLADGFTVAEVVDVLDGRSPDVGRALKAAGVAEEEPERDDDDDDDASRARRAATLARGLVALFFRARPAHDALRRCADAAEPGGLDAARRAAGGAEALSRLRLPRAIVDHVCAYCAPSPFASFARRGCFEARVLAPLLCPDVDAVCARLKARGLFGAVVAVAHGADAAAFAPPPPPEAPKRRAKRRPAPSVARWNVSTLVRRDPTGLAAPCLRATARPGRCLCIQCWKRG